MESNSRINAGVTTVTGDTDVAEDCERSRRPNIACNPECESPRSVSLLVTLLRVKEMKPEPLVGDRGDDAISSLVVPRGDRAK